MRQLTQPQLNFFYVLLFISGFIGTLLFFFVTIPKYAGVDPEVDYLNNVYLNNHPKFDYIHGLYLMFYGSMIWALSIIIINPTTDT